MSDPFQLVKYKKGNLTLELMTVPGSVLKYRKSEGGITTVAQCLYSDVIFKDAKKGDRPTDKEIADMFESADPLLTMIEKGEVQLSQAERKAMVDKKRKEIVNHIHKYYTDPKNKTPHPVARIEQALEEIKYKVDGEMAVERQVAEILKKLPGILAVKKSEVTGHVLVPHAHVGTCQGIIMKWCQVQRENYTGEGCTYEVSLVPGDYDGFLADMNRVTKGEFQFNIDGQAAAAMAASVEEEEKKNKKGKQKK